MCGFPHVGKLVESPPSPKMYIQNMLIWLSEGGSVIIDSCLGASLLPLLQRERDCGGGRWERAPISAPDALPLGRKRSCKLSPALLYTVQGRRRANHRNARAPFKPDISPTGTNCPNNQHPDLLRASGAGVERIAYRACVLRGRIALDCTAARSYRRREPSDSYRFG